jgi:hypothetical protein
MTQTDPTQLDASPPDVAWAPEVGGLIGDRYRVLERLESPGPGLSYRIRQEPLDKELLLTWVRVGVDLSASALALFEERVKRCARLDHTSILPITDFGRLQDGSLYIVQEAIEGPSLAAWRATNTPCSVERSLDVVDQLLSALAHAHENDVIHGHLGPNSATVSAHGDQLRVRIVDFAAPPPALGALDVASQDTSTVVDARPPATRPADADVDAVVLILEEMLGDSGDPALRAVLVERPSGAQELKETLRRHLEVTRQQVNATQEDLSQVDVARRRSTDLSGRLGHIVSSKAFRGLTVLLALSLLAFAGFYFLLGDAARNEQHEEDGVIEMAQKALAGGDRDRAHSLIETARAETPDDARVHLLDGHLHVIEHDERAALRSYARAVKLDPGSAEDAVLVQDLRRILLSEKWAKTHEAMVRVLSRRGDSRAAPLIAEIAQSAPRSSMRMEAFSGLERLGETARIDVIAYLGRELQRAPSDEQSCPLRKWYVVHLADLHDPRTLPILEREKHRRGEWSFFSDGSTTNDCLARILDKSITEMRALRRQSAAPPGR